MANYSLYSGTLVGTPLLRFDLEMALAPGMSEATRASQLTKALAYWQSVAATSKDGNQVFLANTAIGWITAERVRLQSPPPSAVHAVVPV